MNAALASLFKALFPVLIGAIGLGVLALAVAVWAEGHGVLSAAGILLLGCLWIVAAFGIVALQIENNALLHRIAEGVERGGPARPGPERSEAGRPASLAAPVRAAEAGVRGSRGRVEPILRAPRAEGPVAPEPDHVA